MNLMTKDDFPVEQKGGVSGRRCRGTEKKGRVTETGEGGRTDRTGAKHSNLSLLQDVAGHCREQERGRGWKRGCREED